jgi:hypothetical protein
MVLALSYQPLCLRGLVLVKPFSLEQKRVCLAFAMQTVWDPLMLAHLRIMAMLVFLSGAGLLQLTASGPQPHHSTTERFPTGDSPVAAKPPACARKLDRHIVHDLRWQAFVDSLHLFIVGSHPTLFCGVAKETWVKKVRPGVSVLADRGLSLHGGVQV